MSLCGSAFYVVFSSDVSLKAAVQGIAKSGIICTDWVGLAAFGYCQSLVPLESKASAGYICMVVEFREWFSRYAAKYILGSFGEKGGRFQALPQLFIGG